MVSKSPPKENGQEPRRCYLIGEHRPDLAIEVVWTSEAPCSRLDIELFVSLLDRSTALHRQGVARSCFAVNQRVSRPAGSKFTPIG